MHNDRDKYVILKLEVLRSIDFKHPELNLDDILLILNQAIKGNCSPMCIEKIHKHTNDICLQTKQALCKNSEVNYEKLNNYLNFLRVNQVLAHLDGCCRISCSGAWLDEVKTLTQYKFLLKLYEVLILLRV